LLELNSGVTIIWKASYSGVGNDGRECLFFLYGDGTFEIAAEGYIKSTGLNNISTNRVNVTVSGGTVENTGTGCAIYCEGLVTISSGTVIGAASSYSLIKVFSLVMSGGRVISAGEGPAISGPDITVSGGTVENTGEGVALSGSGIKVSGGTVSAKTGDAIHGSGTVTVSGGFVFAYGAGIDDVIGVWIVHYEQPPENVGDAGIMNPPLKRIAPEIGGTAVVCAWNQMAGNTTYTEGMATHLAATPAGTAKWGKSVSQSGINYANGANSGFFRVDGVTVTEGSALSAMSNFIPANSYVSGQFTDVGGNAWYSKVVALAYEYGLMKGSSETTFNPTGNITVAEAITVAARVHSIYYTGADNFTQSAPWYQVYADYAVLKGIIAANEFTDYNRAATRAEMAYIFSRTLPPDEFTAQNTVNSLPDVNSDAPYYNEILMLYKAGVLSGNDEKGTFSPGNNITRAEAAAIISRVILPETRTSGKT
jgi:hypothetical protein